MLQPWLVEGVHRFYNSGVIVGDTSEHSLDIDSQAAFLGHMHHRLNQPLKMAVCDPTRVNGLLKQGSYSTCNATSIKDGHVFRSKKQSLTVTPKAGGGMKISLYLVPEDSAYIGGYCAITVDIFLDVYKLLGGRQFCTEESLYWIKGSNTKIGCQLQLSYMRYNPFGGYQKFEADFMKSDSKRIEAIKLLHMTLASYSYVDNLLKTNDDLCCELATLIYNDAVLPWKPNAPASIIQDIKNEWLKVNLIL